MNNCFSFIAYTYIHSVKQVPLKLCYILQDKASQLFFFFLSACAVEVSVVLRVQRGESDTQNSGRRKS